MPRLTRRYRPLIPRLEGRTVPAQVYPIGFIGPVEVGAIFLSEEELLQGLEGVPGGGYANLDFPMPPPPVPNPIMIQDGMSDNSIGGEVRVSIFPAAGFLIEKVEYSIDTDVVDDQTWNNSFGNYHKTNGFTHTHTPAASVDILQFWWPEVPGTYTLTAKVTHNDVGHTVKTLQKTYVVAPPVLGADPLTVHGQEELFGDNPMAPGWNISFYQELAPNSIWYTFDVASVPEPARFGLIQFAQVSFHAYGTAVDYLLDTPDGFWWLDSVLTSSDPLYHDWQTHIIMPADPAQSFNSSTYSVWDSPAWGMLYDAYPTNRVWAMDYLNSFMTYVDYQPIGGIHVALSHAAWTLSGDASYTLIPPGNTTMTQNADPDNWTYTTNPGSSWTQTGHTFRELLTWSGNIHNAVPFYDQEIIH